MGPSASVVIPDLNSTFIAQTLAGLREQGLPDADTEVIVVGRDEPGQVPRDGSVQFVATDRDLNPGAARNLGVRAARGKFLLFIDADCRPHPAWAAALRAALETAPVVGGAVEFARRGNRWAVADNIASFHELPPDRPAELDTRRPLGSLNPAIRRNTWDEVGEFDESLPTSEDFDWVLRARARGIATAFEPRAVVEHLPARPDRSALVAHATWYGRHFNDFRAKHPDLLDTGVTWSSRACFAAAAPVKAIVSTLAIFRRHPSLWGSMAALSGVIAFKRAWYRAVLENWRA